MLKGLRGKVLWVVFGVVVVIVFLGMSGNTDLNTKTVKMTKSVCDLMHSTWLSDHSQADCVNGEIVWPPANVTAR